MMVNTALAIPTKEALFCCTVHFAANIGQNNLQYHEIATNKTTALQIVRSKHSITAFIIPLSPSIHIQILQTDLHTFP